ncbi:MAG: hypothetical protein ACK2U1_10835, partial [Anaerolineales bacterium]
MKYRKLTLVAIIAIIAMIAVTTSALAVATTDDVVAICNSLYGAVFGVPNGEPLAACQWDMALINATESGSYNHATGAGVTV